MKKFIFLIIFILLFSSCSLTNSSQTVIPSPTIRSTSTPAPSATPTVPTTTFTNTPTLITLPRTDTPTLENPVIESTATHLILITPNTATPSPKIDGFISVLVSDSVFYKGKKCQPTSVNFTVQVSQPNRSSYVLLFVRFKGKRSGITGVWTSIKMDFKGAGTYTHDLIPDEMLGLASFQNAWVEYQLVTTEQNAAVIGRTDIFSERLSLLDCVASPTPEISSTPTVLTP